MTVLTTVDNLRSNRGKIQKKLGFMSMMGRQGMKLKMVSSVGYGNAVVLEGLREILVQNDVHADHNIVHEKYIECGCHVMK